jgi:hypothetical protein
MVLSSQNSTSIEKHRLRNISLCPFCHEKITLGIEQGFLNSLSKESHSIYSHIHLHGNPLHAMVCYIDKNFEVRSIEVVKSIEIERKSDTFQQFLQKWSNPS